MFDSEGISKCFVPYADPRTCFYNSRVTREKLTAPVRKRQVKRRRKRFAGELGSTKQL